MDKIQPKLFGNISKNENNNKDGGGKGGGPSQQQSSLLQQVNQQQQQSSTVQQNEFNLDIHEYEQVFKVFDKDNSGEINIHQVFELINKFENQSIQSQGKGNNNGNNRSHGGVQGSGQGYSKGGQRGSIYGSNINGQGGKHQSTNSSIYQNGVGGSRRNTQGMIGSVHDTNNKYSPSRKNVMSNGVNSNAGGNILQLRPTQLNGSNKSSEISNITNRSPRRQSHIYHGNKDLKSGGTLSIKLNGIQASNNTNSQHGQGGIGASSNKSDKLSNEDEKDNIRQHNDLNNNSDIIDPKARKKHGVGQTSSNANDTTNGGANSNQITSSSTPTVIEFPNGKETLKFDEFINIIRDSCSENDQAENYLVLAFSMFDRQKKGYINMDDLKNVFQVLGESITDEEVNTMIKIAGIKSNDKINFKEFVDFFYKID